MVPVYWHPPNQFHYRKTLPTGRELAAQYDPAERHISHSKPVRKSNIYSEDTINLRVCSKGFVAAFLT